MTKQILTLIIGSSLLFTGCVHDPVPAFDVGEVLGMKPIYEEDLVITKEDSRPLISSGKILSYGPILLIQERGSGLHVIDNSDPSNPAKLFFISIPENNDLTVKDGLLLVDNGPDLVSIEISSDTLVEVSRVRSIFALSDQDVSEFPSQNEVYYECPEPSKGPVIAWKQATLFDPKCYKRR